MSLLVLVFGGWAVGQYLNLLPSGEKAAEPIPVVETTHDLVLEEVQALGKLELVKYRIKDVVEHKKVNRFLPDAKVLLVVTGEVVGCIDLTQIKAESIFNSPDTVQVRLPAPEVCYSKIDHQNSKVYDTQYTIITGVADTIVAGAFRKAEAKLADAVKEIGLLEETKKNAQTLLKPLFENMTEKTVLLTFPTDSAAVKPETLPELQPK